MIDPYKITNYHRTDEELEEFWLFCLAVAGKKATMMAGKVDQFLAPMRDYNERVKAFPALQETPYEYILGLINHRALETQLRAVKMGKYKLLEQGYRDSAVLGNQHLRTASADALTAICGAGYKTSRFFTLHSRQFENVAVIDTHMLKYINHIGAPNVPDGIPVGKEYLRLESILLADAASKSMVMADYDLKIWSHYASKGASPLP